MRSRRLLLGLLVMAALLSALPASASAAPIRECNMAWDGTRWHYGRDARRVQGYSAGNFTTRVASCRTARRVFGATRRIQANSDREWRRKAKRTRAVGRVWRCLVVASRYGWSDIRCTARGGRVVRWQEGS